MTTLSHTTTMTTVTSSRLWAPSPAPSPASNNWKVDTLPNGDIRISSDNVIVTASKADGGRVTWQTLDRGIVTAHGESTGDPHDSASKAGESGSGQHFDSSGDTAITIPMPEPNGTTMVLKRVTADNGTPIPGQKEPTFNGSVMIGSERDGIVTVDNLHGDGPLRMGESYPNYPGLTSSILNLQWANQMKFDPVKGRMVDPHTGQEITQASVDRNDLIRGGYPAVLSALNKGGAFMYTSPDSTVWADRKAWDDIDVSKLSWMQQERRQDARRQDARQQEARRYASMGPPYAVNQFVPADRRSKIIPMPRTCDCPNPGVAPLDYALSEFNQQWFAKRSYDRLTDGSTTSVRCLLPTYNAGWLDLNIGGGTVC